MNGYFEYCGATEMMAIIQTAIANPDAEWVQGLREGHGGYNTCAGFFAEGVEHSRNESFKKTRSKSRWYQWSNLSMLMEEVGRKWRPADWRFDTGTPEQLASPAMRACLIVRLLSAGFCIRLSSKDYRYAVEYWDECSYEHAPTLIEIIEDVRLWNIVQINHTAAAQVNFNYRGRTITEGVPI
jgi:hypothetical protein